MYGLQAGTEGEKDVKLDHGVMVPMWFINGRYTGHKAVRVSQSGMEPSAHYKMGIILKEAVDTLNRKTVLIASADMSHKLKKDGPYGYAHEGPVFDEAVVKALSCGDFLALMMIDDNLRERAAECGYNSLMVLSGAFDRRQVKAEVLSYEGPFGVGYIVASFSPGEQDDSRDILRQYEEKVLQDVQLKQESADPFRALARRSLEHRIMTGRDLPVPNDVPDEMLSNKAGVFVSLHKNGRLRGCIGTIAPTTANIAGEIIQNAVSAGLKDNRFDPVAETELRFLTYKVDVLAAPEKISGPGELDVKRYGVIVSNGYKRGLLLPNLDGVDTVEEQIAIARKKGGIAEREPVQLERFEVVRHE